MALGAIPVFLGLLLAAGVGFLAAWFLRREAMERSLNYTSSLEQLVAGLMRERDSALERERASRLQVQKADESLTARVRELEKELEHRETQVIAFRDEAMHVARVREELAQRLARHEKETRELEAALNARIEELQSGAGLRGPGQRATGAERELAALVAAHETDLAELEARYLVLIQSKDAEIERLRSQRPSQAVIVPAAEEPPAPAAAEPEPAAETTTGNGTDPSLPPATGRKSRRQHRRSRDDLTQIPGIDASLEQALLLVGITSFKQVARWKEKDVERIAKKLYQSPERIRAEQWVEKAREAYTRKYGGTP